MALTKCKECGHQVSTEAKSCPQCGAKIRKPASKLGIILVTLIAIPIFGAIFNHEDPLPKPPRSPEEIAAAAKREEAFQMTVAVARLLKKSMHDPSSLTWEAIGTNDDASLICFEYRAKNAFGAIVLGRAAYANGRISTGNSAWNKNCAGKSLNDRISARQAI